METFSLVDITVVIPTLNRELVVLNTLDALANQTVIGFNVLIIDQSDESPNLLKEYSNPAFSCHYHHLDVQNLPVARNYAAQVAKTELLIYIDDDVDLDSKLVESYLAEFNRLDHDYWVIGGRVWEKGSTMFHQTDKIVGGTITSYGKTLKNFDTDRSGDADSASGGNFGVRRSRFMQVGGFDKSLANSALLEDSDFCYRVRQSGGKVYFSALPSLEHLRVPTGGTRRWTPKNNMYDRAFNTVIFFRRYKSIWLLPLVFTYLQAVVLQSIIRGKYPLGAILSGWFGFFTALFRINIKPHRWEFD